MLDEPRLAAPQKNAPLKIKNAHNGAVEPTLGITALHFIALQYFNAEVLYIEVKQFHKKTQISVIIIGLVVRTIRVRALRKKFNNSL